MNSQGYGTGSSCPPPNVLTIFIGDDVTSQLIALTKNGSPVDLTGSLEIEIDFANDPSNNPNLVFAAKLTTGQISISSPVNPVLGHLGLSLTSAETALFQAIDLSNLDVIVTNPSGLKQTYRIYNGLSVVLRVAG